MTDHATTARSKARKVADEVRAEMARQKKTAGQLAEALGVTPHTVGRRLNGDIPFDMAELYVVADYLDVPLTQLTATGRDRGARGIPA